MFYDICPRSVSKKIFLANHLELDHLKARPSESDTCNFTSFTRNNLKDHMLRHGSKVKYILNKCVMHPELHLSTRVLINQNVNL